MSGTTSITSSSPTRWIDLGTCFLGLSICAVIITITLVCTIVPMEAQLNAYTVRAETARKLIALEAGLRSEFSDVSHQLNSRESTFTQLNERIPETPRESEFLAQITEVARDCQLRIKKYHPMEPVNEGAYSALEIQLDASADYAGVCRFLDGLRTISRLCRITRLRLQSANPDADDLPMEMTLRIYYASSNKSPKT